MYSSTVNVSSNTLEDFMLEGLNPSGSSPAPATPAPAAPANTNSVTPPTPTNETAQPSTGEAVSDENLEDDLVKDAGKGGGEGKQTETQPIEFFKDYEEMSRELASKNLIYPFGTPENPLLPKTKEEFFENLELSNRHNAQQLVKEEYEKAYQAMSPSVQRIYELAARGVTTATDIERYTQALAQRESIEGLDPKNPEHQKHIIYMHLKNTSALDDNSIRAEIDDLTERKKLDVAAERYFPALKKQYDDRIAKEDNESKQKEENFERMVKDNAIFTQHFLNNEKDNINKNLPFEIASDDHAYKKAIYGLASQVVDIDIDGDPVYAWQDRITALQYGNPDDFKKFLKVCAFLADMDKYDASTAAKGASKENRSNFMQIITNGAAPVNHDRQTAPAVTRQPETPSTVTKQPSRWSGR